MLHLCVGGHFASHPVYRNRRLLHTPTAYVPFLFSVLTLHTQRGRGMMAPDSWGWCLVGRGGIRGLWSTWLTKTGLSYFVRGAVLGNNAKIRSNTRHNFYVEYPCGKNHGRQSAIFIMIRELQRREYKWALLLFPCGLQNVYMVD
jgi:hypothetical protein